MQVVGPVELICLLTIAQENLTALRDLVNCDSKIFNW